MTPIQPTFRLSGLSQCRLDFSKPSLGAPSLGEKRQFEGELPPLKRTKTETDKYINARTLSQKKHNLHSEYNDQYEPTGIKVITIRGRNLQLTELNLNLDSKHENHNIYEFVPNQPDLEIQTREISEDGEETTRTKTIILAETILKIPSTQHNDRKKTNLLIDTIKAIHRLEEDGVPLAEVFAHPGNFVDSENEKNGGFYLVKKMTTSIRSENRSKGIQNPLNDAVVLAFVKEWITKSANDKRIYIADFRADNVMQDENRKVFVVDPDLSPDKQDFEEVLYGTIKHWAGQTRDHFLTLIEDFVDAELKERLVSWYDKGYEPKDCVNG